MRAGAALQGRGVGQDSQRATQRERCRQPNSITPQTTQAGMANNLKKLALNRIGLGSGENDCLEVNKP
ncbi:hypothetical protein M2244_000796 [Rhodoferax antarcticus]|nr:hypothetical protein [Rhodoferax antarcticus]